MSKRIILASTSPRRRELLAVFDFPFDVIGSDYDEEQLDCDSMAPQDAVMELALQKALTVAQKIDGDALVIGADTTVVLDGRYYQKPEDPADARRMLSELSGRTHQVYTGICVVPVTDGRIGVPETDYASTDVTFDKIPEDVIDAYVATGEPLDKAGAYGIQGKALAFIPGIKGDYFNVVGLPIEVIRKHLLPYFPDLPPAPSQPTFPAENYGDFSWTLGLNLSEKFPPKKYTERDAIGAAGESFVSYLINKNYGWPYRNLSADLGLDGEIEVIDRTESSERKIIRVQVKTHKSLPNKDPISEGGIKKSDIFYWKLFQLPVILVVVDLSTNTAFWRHINPEFYITESNAETMSIEVSRSQVFDESSREKLRSIAYSHANPSILNALNEMIEAELTKKGNTNTVDLVLDQAEFDRISKQLKAMRQTIKTLADVFPWMQQEADMGQIDETSQKLTRYLSDWQHQMMEANY